MKTFFRNIHLYLSLAAGLVIMSSCITGTILVFEEEINELFFSKRYFVKVEGNKLPIENLLSSLKTSNPQYKPSYIKVYSDPEKSAEIGISIPDNRKKEGLERLNKKGSASKAAGNLRNKDSKGKKEGGRPNAIAYINPYSGQVLEIIKRQETFLFKVEMFHRWFMGGKGSIGQQIVGISTFMFLFILITGIVLWWPKTKKILQKRLKIKWDGKLKRLNHDLHMVMGFYLSVFLIIIALTGLVMSYNWINKGIFTLTGSSMENQKPPLSIQSMDNAISADSVYQIIKNEIGDSEWINIKLPNQSDDVFTLSTLPQNALKNYTDTYYIDQYSGHITGNQLYQNKNTGQKIRSYIKYIHTGAIYGMPTKVLSFIICLFSISFPVTGVVMWCNRKKFFK